MNLVIFKSSLRLVNIIFFLNCPLPEALFQLVQHNTVPHHFRTGPQIIFYSGGRVRALTGKMRLVLNLGKTILVHNKDPMGRGRKKYKISNRMYDIFIGQREIDCNLKFFL